MSPNFLFQRFRIRFWYQRVRQGVCSWRDRGQSLEPATYGRGKHLYWRLLEGEHSIAQLINYVSRLSLYPCYIYPKKAIDISFISTGRQCTPSLCLPIHPLNVRPRSDGTCRNLATKQTLTNPPSLGDFLKLVGHYWVSKIA